MMYFFSNSCGYYCLKDKEGLVEGSSYINRFMEEYGPDVGGHWASGLTLLDIKKNIKHTINGEGSLVVFHVGICEAFTKGPVGFLSEALKRLRSYGMSAEFELYMLPRLLDACNTLDTSDGKFYNMIEPEHFYYVFDSIIKILTGQRIIIIGIGEPDPEKWANDASAERMPEYDEVLRLVAKNNGVMFIDAWNSYKGMLYDNCHLIEAAHDDIYKRIKDFV